MYTFHLSDLETAVVNLGKILAQVVQIKVLIVFST